MKPSYVTCLASTITGFFLKTQIHVSEVPRLFPRWGFPTDRVFLQEGWAPMGASSEPAWGCPRGAPLNSDGSISATLQKTKHSNRPLTGQAFNIRRNCSNIKMCTTVRILWKPWERRSPGHTGFRLSVNKTSTAVHSLHVPCWVRFPHGCPGIPGAHLPPGHWVWAHATPELLLIYHLYPPHAIRKKKKPAYKINIDGKPALLLCGKERYLQKGRQTLSYTRTDCTTALELKDGQFSCDGSCTGLKKKKKKAGTKPIYQSLTAWSGMEICIFNVFLTNTTIPLFIILTTPSGSSTADSNLGSQVSPSPRQGDASPSLPHTFRPFLLFFLHTTIWQAKHISKLPFWNKGSRNQESSCAFPAQRREK